MPTVDTEQHPLLPAQPAAAARPPADGLFHALLGTIGERPAPPELPKPERATDRTRTRKERQFAHDVAAPRDLPASWSLVPARDATSQAVERMRTRGEPSPATEQGTSSERNVTDRARIGVRTDGREQSSPAKNESSSARPATPQGAASQGVESTAPRALSPAAPHASSAERSTPVAPEVGASTRIGAVGRVPAGPAVARVDATGQRATVQPGATVVRGASGATGVNTSRTTMRAPAPPQPPARPEPLPQVVRGLALALRQGGGSVSMKMHPENLGTVTVRLRVDGGEVRARLETTEDSARRLLLDSTDELRSALEARGLRVERIEVGGAEDRPADQRQAGADEPRGDSGGRQRRDDPEHEGAEAPVVLVSNGPVLTIDHAGRVRLEAIA